MGRKSSELSEGCKENIFSLLQDGKSFGEVAGLLKIPKSTVYSVWKKFRSQGSTENKHRITGRPHCTETCQASSGRQKKASVRCNQQV